MKVEQSKGAESSSELPREGDDQDEPLNCNLEKRLYPFESEPTEVDISPERRPNLDASKTDDIRSLISQFPSVFSNKPGRKTVTQHHVYVGDATPIHQRPYRIPYSRRAAVKQELDQMLAENIIRPSTSP